MQSNLILCNNLFVIGYNGDISNRINQSGHCLLGTLCTMKAPPLGRGLALLDR